MIGGVVLLAVVGLTVMYKPGTVSTTNPTTIKNTATITSTPSAHIETTVSPTITDGEVPLPQATDIIRSFFSLIEERRISDAVRTMSDSINNDDSQKQAWGVQLNAMKSVKVVDITPSMQEEWKENMRTYKVTLDIVMDPSSANQPIPYYGYEKGENIRWISLERPGKMWKVMGIGTGP